MIVDTTVLMILDNDRGPFTCSDTDSEGVPPEVDLTPEWSTSVASVDQSVVVYKLFVKGGGNP